MNQTEYFRSKLDFEIDACDLHKAIKQDGDQYVIVDSRSERAYNLTHIKGAVSLPYGAVTEEQIKTLDKSKIYITYCDGLGCNASTKGAYMLSSMGFKVKEMIGGLDAWKYEGYEIDSNLTEDEYREAVACGPMCSCHN